jgi:DNA polymerase III subunit delta'
MSEPLPTQAISSALVNYHLGVLSTILEQWRCSGKFPPVVLFNGQPGIGIREVVSYLTQLLLCNNKSVCGICPPCLRFNAGNEVNVVEMSSDTEVIKIDAFRRLKASVGFGADEGRFKIIWIFGADRMTHQAANSVLKLLEEPPKGWIFFLTSNDASLLLPTVVSRCQIIRLKPISDNIIKQLLQISGVNSQKIEICATLSQGSWEQALLLSSDETWKQRQALFRFLNNPVKELQTIVDWASQEILNCRLLVDFLEQFAEDLIRWTLTHPSCPPDKYSWLNSDGQEALTQHANSLLKKQKNRDAARSFWLSRSEQLARVRGDFNLPLNRKILLQGLLLPWLEGGHA